MQKRFADYIEGLIAASDTLNHHERAAHARRTSDDE